MYKIVSTFMLIFLTFFIFLLIPQMAFAWGPGVHTLISFNLLDELKAYGSFFYPVVSNNFWEFLYGSLAPDFMVAKKLVSKKNNSHNFDFANKLINSAKNEKELSFALGYLSHLASDKIMHEVFLSDYNVVNSLEHMSLELLSDSYYSSYLNIVSLVLKKKSILDKPLRANLGLVINTFIGKNILRLSTKNIISLVSKNIALNNMKIDKDIVDNYIKVSLKLSKERIVKLK
ncbi:zinc dependent phospholipase C family protein [Desulfurella sp.]|uniref:zinc dependent phospholipase C family protein n=1 Tax=Desulfurella sp. TaxID=1962857 RepID=UPI003D1268BD